MSERDRCRNGNPDCKFDHEHELALASELMRAIGGYSRRENIEACPLCLRDTMLAIAALLHLEAARIGSEISRTPRACTKQLSNALAKAARKALEDVADAKAILVSSQSKH
jgi:hypothetical protein